MHTVSAKYENIASSDVDVLTIGLSLVRQKIQLYPPQTPAPITLTWRCDAGILVAIPQLLVSTYICFCICIGRPTTESEQKLGIGDMRHLHNHSDLYWIT